MTPIRRFKNMRRGQKIWVLGNGPSLQQIPRGFIPSCFSIGCNRVLRTHRTLNVVIVDVDVWKAERERLLAANARVLTSLNLYEYHIRNHYPDSRIGVFNYSMDAKVGDGGGVFYQGGYLTGYYAAEIAAMMVRPGGQVVLAGMDLKYPDDGSPTHSYGYGASEGAAPTKFPEGIAALKKLRNVLKDDVQFSVIGPSALCEGKDPFPSQGFL